MYGTLLNSCSCNTLAMSQKIFIWYFHWERHAIIGRESLNSTLPHKRMGSHVAYGTHRMTTSILIWIKFYKISIKVRIILRLLPFSELLLMANQGGNWTSKVSSMLLKTVLVAYGTKNCQHQNHGHFSR